MGKHKISCPYFQNIVGRKADPVFVGKGLPSEIVRETLKIFKEKKKDLNKMDNNRLRFYMVMVGLGVDCSGFAVRILDEYLREKKVGGITDAIRLNFKNINDKIKFKLQPYTKISSNSLACSMNSYKIENYHDTEPGDLIRFGTFHVAVITTVIKDNSGRVKKIEYYHSTSDYFENHGVRKGSILIVKKGKRLEFQDWTEKERGINFTHKDYLSVNQNNRGIVRLNILGKA
jgi:uncharacterized protein YneR